MSWHDEDDGTLARDLPIASEGDFVCTECRTSSRLVTPATINLAMVRIRGDHSDNGEVMDVVDIASWHEDVSLDETGQSVTCLCDPDAYVARWRNGQWTYWDIDEQKDVVFT